MANQEVKTLSQSVNGGSVVIITQVTQTLTEQDLLAQNQQLQFQQLDLKQQIKRATDEYNSMTDKIANNNELLKQFATPDPIVDGN